jgi:hypothetical protein
MTTLSQTDDQGAQINTETEFAVRAFVRAATPRLNEALKGQEAEWEIDAQWERGSDGHFRVHSRQTRQLWPMLSDDWLRAQPEYNAVIERLKADAVVGPHLDRLVGTSSSATRVEADHILNSLIYGMQNAEGILVFMDESFDSKWLKVVEVLCAKQIPFKTIAPLPHLLLPIFPLCLNDEIALDRLTEQEVTRCCQVGVLRPQSQRYPLIGPEIAVGIRRTTSLPKLVRMGTEPHELPAEADEGSFGRRPLWRSDLIVDDVLSALRLFKRTQLRTSGFASWTDMQWLSGGTSYRVLSQWPYGGEYKLSEGEVSELLKLWQLLENESERFGFSIHRFNLAFDRGLLADRIVDLVIAAESLFLGDQDEKYRGSYVFVSRCAQRSSLTIRPTASVMYFA